VRSELKEGVGYVRRKGEYRDPSLEALQLKEYPLRGVASNGLPCLGCLGGFASRPESVSVQLRG
jgi:hypothetical protein